MTTGRFARPGAAAQGRRRCRFALWAPKAERVEVHFVDSDRFEPLERDASGYHTGELEGVAPGARYRFRLDGGRELPDPASRNQPEGVHGPSQIVEPEFDWDDAEWRGRPLEDYVIYEIHVGTFTDEGGLDAAVDHLEELRDLGVTAVELMPVAQFPGSRNWGYDGVYPFAVQHCYGGASGLKRFVAACHRLSLAAILDVVYNHVGPEGNYLPEFGPYFSEVYRTPWGRALNFDGPGSDEVRRFFTSNALMWLDEFRFDALRLDAVHSIFDSSARPFLAELAEAVEERSRQLGRPLYLIAESDLNAPRFVRPRSAGGHGLDAQWCDDFHHALHALLTGERRGYYADYGSLAQLGRALRDGWVYQGERSAFRGRRHGDSSAGLAGSSFVVCTQNHDQIGNRLRGDRLAETLSPAELRLAAGVTLLAPFVPLLFMGEEYGETAPFPYFTSHGDAGLVEAVRRGRREEFSACGWEGEPYDPQSEATFLRARLRRELREREPHRSLEGFHRELLRLRRSLAPLRWPDRNRAQVTALESEQAIALRRWDGDDETIAVFAFGNESAAVTIPAPAGRWLKRLDSADPRWGGSGSIVPDSLDSRGRLVFEIGAKALALLELSGGEGSNAS